MHVISARDALQYALGQQLARVYAVIIGGWLLVTGGLEIQAAIHSPLELVSYPIILLGVIALYGGSIALLFKVVADANAAATTV